MTPTTSNPLSTPTIPRTPGLVASGPRPVAALVAITAILAYQALSVAAVVANPQGNPLTRQLSEYALGPQGWLQVAAFLASAFSYAALFGAPTAGSGPQTAAGVVNICRYARSLTGDRPLYAVIGGFHLNGPTFSRR